MGNIYVFKVNSRSGEVERCSSYVQLPPRSPSEAPMCSVLKSPGCFDVSGSSVPLLHLVSEEAIDLDGYMWLAIDLDYIQHSTSACGVWEFEDENSSTGAPYSLQTSLGIHHFSSRVRFCFLFI